MNGRALADAIAALHSAGDGDDLCAPFLSALPVTGVAISTLGDPFGSETVCASDPAAARLDEIQLDLGEGPSWQAKRSRTPVLEPNLRLLTSDRWPAALNAMRDMRVGAAFAFPMRLGTLDIGAVNLYNLHPGALDRTVVRDAVALTEAVARHVLRRSLARAQHDDDGVPGGSDEQYSRREVYQASGMLAAQAGASSIDALLLLRAHAYSAGRPVRNLATDVIARTVDFTNRDATDRDDSAS